jgi:hypothetical protein
MRSKSTKKRKARVIYYTAPAKSRASYFFASFFLTLAVSFSAIGFAVAGRNSQRLGWGQDAEVFAVISNGTQVGFTFMDSSYTIDTVYTDYAKDVIGKVKTAYVYLEPEPLRLAEIIRERIYSLEQDFLSHCEFTAK